MKTSLRLAFLLLVLAVATTSCSITVDTGNESPTQTATIIVPATETPTVQPPTATATLTPTQPLPTLQPASATPKVLHFYVSGYVWHDLCNAGDGPVPNPLPPGCVLNSGGGLSADGIFQAGEPGIAGVVVKIELNCNYGAFTEVTDANGFYEMSFTVDANAGVSEQLVCLSVDALDPANVNALIPGNWTSPVVKSGPAVIQLTIPVETQNTVNFGWDFQFQ